MRLRERIASATIGTPLQRPAEALRWLKGWPARRRHPELREIHLESRRMDAVLQRVITDGMNCIDIGAHLGSMLQSMIRLSPRGRHTAVEPLAYKANWLRRKFPQVEVHQLALGDAEGEVEFFYHPGESGFSGLRVHDAQGVVEKTTVQCRRLDDVVPAERRVGFVKIDVEGAEFGVIRGGRRFFTENRPFVLFECTRSGLASFEITSQQVFALLTDDFGYRVYLLKDWLSGGGPLSVEHFESSMHYPFQAFNYLAEPQPL